MNMTRFLPLVFLALVPTGHLYAQSVSVFSPDGRYALQSYNGEQDSVFYVGERSPGRAEITGDSLDSRKFECLQYSDRHGAECAVWSPDSQKVAVGVRTGKNVEDTIVLVRHDDSFRCVFLPDHDSDERMLPLRWRSPSRLVVEITGSWGGHGNDDTFYKIIATYEYNTSAEKFKKIRESKPSFPRAH